MPYRPFLCAIWATGTVLGNCNAEGALGAVIRSTWIAMGGPGVAALTAAVSRLKSGGRYSAAVLRCRSLGSFHGCGSVTVAALSPPPGRLVSDRKPITHNCHSLSGAAQRLRELPLLGSPERP